MKKITLSVVAMTLLASTAMAAQEVNATQSVAAPVVEVKKATAKRTLKGSMVEVINAKPKNVDSLEAMFAEGTVFGRLRTNSFLWVYGDTDATIQAKNNSVTGIGGSLIYKTAKWAGVSATAGLYYSHAITDINHTSIANMRAGKDTFSRYKVINLNDYTMMQLAQAYLQYDMGKTSIKVGQQMWESLLTASNDTKMIPQSFMGATVVVKDIPDVTARAFYFTQQRLRDHEINHDFVTFGTAAVTNVTQTSWNNNDDAPVNKTLTYAALNAIGLANNTMNGADVTYTGIKGLKATVTHNMIPGIVLQEAAEASYQVKLGDMTLTPAARVIVQKDLLGGKIAGVGSVHATNTTGYKSPDSLSGYVWMAKLNAGLMKGVNLQYGFSQVADMADIMAQWRGFATGGYTRAMAQYNWNANTASHMIEGNINLGQLGVLKGSSILARYAIQDFDDAKTGVQGDSNILHVDVTQNLSMLTPGLEAKFRLGMVSDQRAAGIKTGASNNPAYNEYRFEVNYLF